MGRINDVVGRPYSDKDVAKAIALAKKLRSCRAAAMQLGIHPNTVMKWVRDAGIETKNWRGKVAKR